MATIFSPENDRRVLVIGDLILDRYVFGNTSRISPEAPVPIVKVYKTEDRPGGAANVAMNIRALGVEVQLIGITGNDEFADILTSQLLEAGVGCAFIRQDNSATVTKQRILSRNQQLLRLDYEAEDGFMDATPFEEVFNREFDGVTLLVLSDYAKGSLQFVEQYIKRAREKGIKVLVDPKGRDFSRYRGASYITPNLKEFEDVVGHCKNSVEMVEKALILCKSLQLDGIVITRGEEGVSLVDLTGNSVCHLPANAHEVFDVTGAGDTVIATLAAALACSYNLEDAVRFANLAAGLSVEKLGAVSISADELNNAAFRNDSNEAEKGIIQSQRLADVINTARLRGERIVMTNGCFDIIHAGHISYLNEAKTLGQRLLIAVNDDASVRRLKGVNRPVNKLQHRMAVLAGLISADWVCSFSEDTPEELIKTVKPDVLVKGADYSVEEIAGADFVRSYGGKVVTIPFQTECSTTDIIRKIRTIKQEA